MHRFPEIVRGAPEGGRIPSPVLRGKSRAVVFLFLLVPAPTLGVLSAVAGIPGGAGGRIVFAVCKVWILTLPVAALLLEGRRPFLPVPARRDLWTGLAVGVVMALAIAGGYVGFERAIDADRLREVARRFGLVDLRLYVLGACYWVFLNSLVEEYVWRWFVLDCWRVLTSPGVAILAASACFTLHHLAALAFWLPWTTAAVGALGVFAAGIVWGVLRLRFGGIWAAWASHVLADAAIFLIGLRLLFLHP